MVNVAAILILLFFAITYMQSGYEKISDWKGNISQLRLHFSKTFLKDFIGPSLLFLFVLEVISTVLCIVGIIELGMRVYGPFALAAAIFCSVTLLVMLFGQRLARDYEGAKTIGIYFIPAIILVYLLQ